MNRKVLLNITVDDNHPSIQAITENCNFEGNLSFTEISDDFVEKQINKINVNKATGFDGVSVKIMKIAKPAFFQSSMTFRRAVLQP
jgi:hypothetical protein